MKKFYQDPWWWAYVLAVALAINVPLAYILYIGGPKQCETSAHQTVPSSPKQK